MPETVKLFNTLGRKTVELNPLNNKEVGVYCCGPTVYNYQHIGNLRTYIFEDLLVRALRYADYKVNHVMNITDVGHLVSDADDGEDKMALASKREGKKSEEIASYYTEIFFKHCEMLNIEKPSIVCKATEHIAEMISLIEKLIELGAAYQAGGNVYFDVSKNADYGKLAGLDLDALQSGARIEVDSQKKNPHDFALWFTKSKFENQELQWDSPWGRGYPGWHIECSAMAEKYLGPEFDIHCGGIDHIPVHHTNEIAQSETASGQTFAHIWMHGGFLVVDKAKMSKSTGGFLTLDKISEEGLDPLAYRLFCLSGSYRKELSWSLEAVRAADTRLKKLRAALEAASKEGGEQLSLESISSGAAALLNQFKEDIFNDLGFPKALATLNTLLTSKEISPSEKLTLALSFDEVLGLKLNAKQDSPDELPNELPEGIKNLLLKRDEARAAKDWALSDKLRDEIDAEGYTVIDTAKGSTAKVK